VECDEEVNELGKVEYESVKKQFVDTFDDGDDDEGKKRGFLMKNAGWISLEVFLGVLWV
jgi:hypothetical protein